MTNPKSICIISHQSYEGDSCQNVWSQLRSSESGLEAEVEIKLLSEGCLHQPDCFWQSFPRFLFWRWNFWLTLPGSSRSLVCSLGGGISPGLPWDTLFSFPFVHQNGSERFFPFRQETLKTLDLLNEMHYKLCWLPALSLFSYMSYKIHLLFPSPVEPIFICFLQACLHGRNEEF